MRRRVIRAGRGLFSRLYLGKQNLWHAIKWRAVPIVGGEIYRVSGDLGGNLSPVLGVTGPLYVDRASEREKRTGDRRCGRSRVKGVTALPAGLLGLIGGIFPGNGSLRLLSG